MARARTNWRRLQNIRAHVSKYTSVYGHIQTWDRPDHSVAAITCTTLLSFYPHAVLSCVFALIMLNTFLFHR